MNLKEKKILELLYQHGELSVQRLSEILKVSPSSVRRYLNGFNSQPYIRRTHGGIALSSLLPYGSLPVSFPLANDDEARVIAFRAAQLIEPGDVIGLSGGRLCTELALNLRYLENITVVTNAVNVACELVGLPGIKVMVCGGMIDLGSFELVGQLVDKALEGIFIHKFFVGTDGLTLENGLTNRSEAEAEVSRKFASHAGQTIVLSDSTKFRRSNLAQVMPAHKISTLITTSRTPIEILEGFSELGVQILLASLEAKEMPAPVEAL